MAVERFGKLIKSIRALWQDHGNWVSGRQALHGDPDVIRTEKERPARPELYEV